MRKWTYIWRTCSFCWSRRSVPPHWWLIKNQCNRGITELTEFTLKCLSSYRICVIKIQVNSLGSSSIVKLKIWRKGNVAVRFLNLTERYIRERFKLNCRLFLGLRQEISSVLGEKDDVFDWYIDLANAQSVHSIGVGVAVPSTDDSLPTDELHPFTNSSETILGLVIYVKFQFVHTFPLMTNKKSMKGSP